MILKFIVNIILSLFPSARRADGWARPGFGLRACRDSGGIEGQIPASHLRAARAMPFR
jgi:hypothetical protein